MNRTKEVAKLSLQLLLVALVVILLVFVVQLGLNASSAMKDVRELWSQVTLDDLRHTLSIVEKQLDIDILELQIEKQRIDSIYSK